jgi:hypothetical protein
MVHQFDRHRTELFFNETFGKLVAPQLPRGLRHRDRIVLEKIIEPASGGIAQDFGFWLSRSWYAWPSEPGGNSRNSTAPNASAISFIRSVATLSNENRDNHYLNQPA